MISNDTKKIVRQKMEEIKASLSVIDAEIDGLNPKIATMTARRDQLLAESAERRKALKNMKTDIGEQNV